MPHGTSCKDASLSVSKEGCSDPDLTTTQSLQYTRQSGALQKTVMLPEGAHTTVHKHSFICCMGTAADASLCNQGQIP